MSGGPDRGELRRQLVEHGLVVDAGVDGLYGRSADYEMVAAAVMALTTRVGEPDAATSLHFPPVIPRALLLQTDYLRSFPDLVGSVHCFRGDDRQHADMLTKLEQGQDWTAMLQPSEVTLRPAACHPVYPLCTGRLPAGGRRFEVHGWCFRHEPSLDPARMLAFRMHEFVFVGEPDGALEHAERWLGRGQEMLESLGLEVDVVVANDPFFGRAGRVLAAGQRDEALKLEFVTTVTSEDAPTAITSVNRHQDHFGHNFGIECAAGTVAHSACFAVGVDRTTLALLRRHGFDPNTWPTSVRGVLWP
ncbi:MAG TPA: amino acid--[acyl-carrier-protein] ligase [Acidimicrobiales bacterium]|nr:amino acid--[acyl-carrier-protein] ligase [Acidimicrobiales bacterium]